MHEYSSLPAPHPDPGAGDSAETGGLSEREAADRRRQFGPNTIRTQTGRSRLRQFAERLGNPLIAVLLIASLVSAATGEIANFIIISVIVLFSVSIDFLQEVRAHTAAEKLRASVAVTTLVMRDGRLVERTVVDLVPGDWVWLSAGDLVPADGLVLQARDLFINQSMLTGESFPVEKHAAPQSATSHGLEPTVSPEPQSPIYPDLQQATDTVFMGTSVIGGSAVIRVTRTGMRSALGDIADSLRKPSHHTALERETRRFGMFIVRLTLLLVLFVLLINAWFQRPWLESFLFAIALAVGLTPELLPMVVSVTLSRGAIRLSQLKLIVKRKTAIQELGAMNVFCVDKTGTLTEARITLIQHVDLQGNESEKVLSLAYLNSHFETGLKSPLDEAILSHRTITTTPWRKVDEIPFDFERRCVSVLIDDGTRRWLIAKGAPEDIMSLCGTAGLPDSDEQRTLNGTALNEARQTCSHLEAQGLRVIAVAWREVERDHEVARAADEKGLVLAGFAAFLDPPKPSAAQALAQLKRAGLTVKILTGDSEAVTRHVCQQLGVAVRAVMLGHEIAAMDDRTLRRRVDRATLFCRVTPAQKERVIRALQANGHVVGYMGDGINDAPSLTAADVGLSLISAVDVAKAAADMILLEQDLNVLHQCVIEGRRTSVNILKYILMGTSSNFGNMFSMAGASLFLPFLPMQPTQVLLNNILYDISEIPIPLDQVDARETRHPRTLDLALIRRFMLVIGPVSSLFDFLTFYALLKLLGADETLFQTGWFIESLCTQVLVVFVIRTRGNPFSSRPHPALILTSSAVILVALLLPLTALGEGLGFAAPPLQFYLLLLGLVVAYLLVVQVIKQTFYRYSVSKLRRPVQQAALDERHPIDQTNAHER
jgi:Mg2+-importing ATPase